MLGFVLIVITTLTITFRRHPLGPFAKYIQPKNYHAIRFTKNELNAIRLCVCLVISGIASMGIVVLGN